MTELRVSYTLDSTLETVDSAEQTASRIAAETGFDEDQVMQISMAVREAAVVSFTDHDGFTKPMAYVVLRQGYAQSDDLIAELCAAVRPLGVPYLERPVVPFLERRLPPLQDLPLIHFTSLRLPPFASAVTMC